MRTARADALTAIGRIDEAIQIHTEILKMNLSLSQASIACQNRGAAYRQGGNDDKAMQDYEQAIRFDPYNPGASVNRGTLLAKRGDPQAAIMDYNEAIRFLDPKMYQAFFNRALAHRAEGDLDLAERDLTEAVHLNEDFALAYVERGFVYLRQKKLDRARADYETAIRLNPKLAGGYIGRARASKLQSCCSPTSTASGRSSPPRSTSRADSTASTTR